MAQTPLPEATSLWTPSQPVLVSQSFTLSQDVEAPGGTARDTEYEVINRTSHS